ncbi:MAG: CBS domain-containing protein [Planctomycetes bacterium]|nr:CBS domain-containing protein [Planctomycetota bacterium]
MDTHRLVLTAEHAMQRNVFVLAPERPVLDAVRELLARGYSGAPVVVDRRLCGIFSERDGLTAIAAAHYEGEPPGTVAQHMRRDFAVVTDQTDLFEVASVFRDHPIRRVPVVDRAGRLLGILSRGDVLKALMAQFPHRQKSQYERLQEHMGLRHGAMF